MELEIRAIGVDPESKNLLVEIDGEEIQITFKELSTEVRILLSPIYFKKLKEIEQSMGLSSKETLMALMDFYYLEDPAQLKLLRDRILSRIKRGVDSALITQLKLTYTALGHFLKKARFI